VIGRDGVLRFEPYDSPVTGEPLDRDRAA
jgi:hypothetical protein